MIKRWPSFALSLVALVCTAPSYGAHGNSERAFGWLFADGSCAQTAFALTPCPCMPPVISAYVFSTKIDLSGYANHFVDLRGSTQPGSCSAGLFEVKKATIVPDISCPCPASVPALR